MRIPFSTTTQGFEHWAPADWKNGFFKQPVSSWRILPGQKETQFAGEYMYNIMLFIMYMFLFILLQQTIS